ncbi:MAG: hypothetical protein J6B20_01390 [Clostridia bacterium]|nr:hypothetical protein [Clostridia bacterium]
MDKIWDITIDFLGKINTWIPLVAVLWAGIGLIGVVLILAITGCALRKRLVPNWLIWTYFIFASIIIFAQADNDIFTVVKHMEVPFLVVLLCYVLRSLFYRRPRYTYSERMVCVREIDKTRPVKTETVVESETIVRKMEEPVLAETESNDDVANEVKFELETEANEENQTAVEEVKEEVKVDEAVAEADNAETKTTESVVAETTTETNTVDLPVVEPIPDKAYEPAPEPTIVATPVSETMPNLKMPNTTIQLRNTTARPTATTSSFKSSASTSSFATRPTATTSMASRPTTLASTTATRPTSSFSSMYNSRLAKPVTTSTTTSTNTNTLNSMNTTRTAGSLGTNVTATRATANTTTPRSTDDIMAAIERLRASMKK